LRQDKADENTSGKEGVVIESAGYK
jgi:hypothetical protein